MQINKKFADYVKKRRKEGKNSLILYGGRRSTKTYSICQYLLLRAYNEPNLIVHIHGVSGNQMKLGPYQDMKSIVDGEERFKAVFDFKVSPLEVRNKINNSRISFNSFATSEGNKGGSCDILFLNEANNFTKEEFFSLSCNCRDLIIFDFNPVQKFWISELYEESDMLHLVFQDNPFLTDLQLEYFRNLKRLAEQPNATSIDLYNYNVNYLGNYGEISGSVFTKENIKKIKEIPSDVSSYMIFLDPSALRGADYFACALTCKDKQGNMYVVDSFSINTGIKQDIAQKCEDWCKNYDVKRLYVEVNGIIGVSFYEYLINSYRLLPTTSWNSRDNKFQRIIANYENLTQKTYFKDTPQNNSFLDQIYTFEQKCEHDDNIDAVNNSWLAQNFK